jgi:hypothetical protein
MLILILFPHDSLTVCYLTLISAVIHKNRRNEFQGNTVGGNRRAIEQHSIALPSIIIAMIQPSNRRTVVSHGHMQAFPWANKRFRCTARFVRLPYADKRAGPNSSMSAIRAGSSDFPFRVENCPWPFKTNRSI